MKSLENCESFSGRQVEFGPQSEATDPQVINHSQDYSLHRGARQIPLTLLKYALQPSNAFAFEEFLRLRSLHQIVGFSLLISKEGSTVDQTPTA